MGYGLGLTGCLVAAIVLAVMLPALTLPIALGFLLAALFCFLTCCIVLSRDIAHPKLTWSTEQEAIKQSFGTLIGLLVGWGMLIALGILSYFLLDWGFGMYAYFGAMAALLLIGAFFAYRALMRSADLTYCQGE